jgi:hypothetical protein
MVPKLKNMLKHVSRHKTKVVNVDIVVGFFNSTIDVNMHVMNDYTQSLSVLQFWI